MLERLLNSIWYGRTKKEKVPIMLILGMPGSGKTTLLTYLLHLQKSSGVAVLLNQLGHRATDAQILADEHKLNTHNRQLIPLNGGCICCNLQEPLYKSVESLINEKHLNYIFIEASYTAEPWKAARLLTSEDHHREIQLHYFSRLDAVVTIVDVSKFYYWLNQHEPFTAGEENIPFVHRSSTSASLFLNLIEKANILILNKTELIPNEELDKIAQLVQLLNPSAQLLKVSYGQVEPSLVFNTSRFNGANLLQHPTWLDDYSQSALKLQSSGYRYVSFADRRPFHPGRFLKCINKWVVNHQNVRIRGCFWLVSRPSSRINIDSVLGHCRFFQERPWWASMPESERIKNDAYLLQKSFFRQRWDEHFGDRMNELLFIGEHLNEADLRMELEDCLCTPEEIAKAKSGHTFYDNFPAFEAVSENTMSKQRFKYLEHFFRIQ